MVGIPFALFLGLFIWCWRKNGLCTPGSYILLLYLLISLFSIILDINNYYAASCKNMGLEFFPTLLYCILLTICIYPYITHGFSNFNPFISKRADKILRFLTYFYAGIFCIILMVSLTRLQYVLTSNALAEIRNEQYTGETVSFYDHLSGLPRYVCALCSIFAPSGYIMTLIFFYNIAFKKRSLSFNILTILGSMSQLLIAVNIADRSNFAYWFLLIGLGLSFFYVHLTKKQKLYTSVFLSSIAFLFLSYFIAVSISRFENRSGGTEGGLVLYAGQSFINFCNFISYIDPGDSLCEIFPFINKLTGGEGYFDVAYRVETTNHNKMMISVFSTFLGYIYSISGGLVLIMYVLFYNRISSIVTRNRKEFFLGDIIRIWVFSLVLVLGLFGYFYSFANNTLALVLWLTIASVIKKRHYLKRTIR